MIKVFACFYNEAALVPFFLSHYHFVNAIEAFVSPSIDATREMLAADPRVIIRDVVMPDGIDDDMKVMWLNEAIRQPDNDHAWHIVVDSDELLWAPGDPSGQNVESYLSTVSPHDAAVNARMVHVYRHADDQDLDLTKTPVVLQRRHGVDALRIKPIVVRPNRGLHFIPGNHRVFGGSVSESHYFDGAHWQNADPSFAVTRRVRDRRDRMSAINRARGHGIHHYHMSAQDVQAELEEHRYDAQRF